MGVLRSAEVNIAPGGSWNSLTGVIIGDSGNGTVNINGGLWTAEANSSVLLGSDGHGKVNISGGGRWLSRAAVTVGDLQFGSGAIVVGDGNDANTAQWTSDAAVEILSGSVELRSGGCWLSSGGVTVGADDGSGSILISGGTWKIPYAAWLHGGTSLTMTGGKIQAATLRIDGTASISGGSIELPNAGSLLLVTGQMLRLNGAEICGDGTILTEYGVGLGNGRLAGSDSSHRLTVNADLFGPGLAEHVDLLGQIHLGPAAGQLTLRDVNFGIDAALVLEIDASVADDNGRLVLGPFTELDGVGLQIVFADGFVPAGGSEIELVCAGDGTSLAAALSGAAVQVPEGCSFDSTTGVLTVIPEPTTIALLAAGAVGLIRRRGRSARRQRRA
ncbi:MAG: PEP-CTERM sorting domain-containing protein [Phycisphaerae bacterium]